MAERKRELEKYIGKLGTTIVDSSIQFAVHFMFQTLDTKESSESLWNRAMEQISSLLHLKLTPRLACKYCARKKTFALRALRAPYI